MSDDILYLPEAEPDEPVADDDADPWAQVETASGMLAHAHARLAKLEAAVTRQDDLVQELSDLETEAHEALRAASVADAIDGTSTADPATARETSFRLQIALQVQKDLAAKLREQRRLVGLPAEDGDPDPPRSQLVLEYDNALRDVARPMLPALEAEISDLAVRLATAVERWHQVTRTAEAARAPLQSALVATFERQHVNPATFEHTSWTGEPQRATAAQLRALYTELKIGAPASE